MKRVVAIVLLLWAGNLLAQSGMEQFLSAVEKNNKELKAARQQLAAQMVANKTEMNPADPRISYSNMPGTKAEYGDKWNVGVSQTFDFPTVYSTKRKLAKQKSTLNDAEYNLLRQQVLLDAKLVYVDFVYLAKKEKENAKRLVRSEKLYQSYQREFEVGNVSILDFNKAKIQYLNQKSQYKLTRQEMLAKQKELELFSSAPIAVSDTAYVASSQEGLAELINERKAKDPSFSIIENQKQVAQLDVKLQKQKSLPNFEVGFGQDNEPAATFRGFQAGMSIPLWQNSNKVKLARAGVEVANTRADALLAAKVIETEKLFQQKEEYAQVMVEYEEILKDATNIHFLDKALELGHLSVIEYFNELAFYYQSIDEFLKIEKEFFRIDAMLNGFKL